MVFPRLGLLTKGIDVAAGREEDREFVSALYAETVDGYIDILAVIRIAAEYKPHAEEGSGVLRRVGWGRQDGSKIEAGVMGAIDHLLAESGFPPHGDGWRYRDKRPPHLHAQFPLGRAEQMTDPFAAGKQAHQNAAARIAFDIVEHHRRADARWPHHGAAGANVAVDAGQFCIRLDLMAGFEILPGNRRSFDRARRSSTGGTCQPRGCGSPGSVTT